MDVGAQSVIAQYHIMEKYEKERSFVFGGLFREKNGWALRSGGAGFDGVHDAGGGAIMRFHGMEMK